MSRKINRTVHNCNRNRTLSSAHFLYFFLTSLYAFDRRKTRFAFHDSNCHFWYSFIIKIDFSKYLQIISLDLKKRNSDR
ncbi:hypothetical protein CEXT_146901 [Caerostris extrusa]|uniref:Uncharacterized protein n=1 Tax=Caerostris extrusa TaxID=172846 RepID=A0AAV4XCD4_CAEEX|nr:hypothetical protein CEXT_146901 [Caerostris extrusa]